MTPEQAIKSKRSLKTLQPPFEPTPGQLTDFDVVKPGGGKRSYHIVTFLVSMGQASLISLEASTWQATVEFVIYFLFYCLLVSYIRGKLQQATIKGVRAWVEQCLS